MLKIKLGELHQQLTGALTVLLVLIAFATQSGILQISGSNLLFRSKSLLEEHKRNMSSGQWLSKEASRSVDSRSLVSIAMRHPITVAQKSYVTAYVRTALKKPVTDKTIVGRTVASKKLVVEPLILIEEDEEDETITEVSVTYYASAETETPITEEVNTAAGIEEPVQIEATYFASNDEGVTLTASEPETRLGDTQELDASRYTFSAASIGGVIPLNVETLQLMETALSTDTPASNGDETATFRAVSLGAADTNDISNTADAEITSAVIEVSNVEEALTNTEEVSTSDEQTEESQVIVTTSNKSKKKAKLQQQQQAAEEVQQEQSSVVVAASQEEKKTFKEKILTALNITPNGQHKTASNNGLSDDPSLVSVAIQHDSWGTDDEVYDPYEVIADPSIFKEDLSGSVLIGCANPDPTYIGRELNLTGQNREYFYRLVMGEAGDEGYIGAALVAQSLKDTMFMTGDTNTLSIKSRFKYSGSIRKAPNQTVIDACDYILGGGSAVQHRVIYFYAPDIVRSSFHESQEFVIEYGGHRVFDKRG